MPSRHRTVRKLRADHVGSGMWWCLQEAHRVAGRFWRPERGVRPSSGSAPWNAWISVAFLGALAGSPNLSGHMGTARMPSELSWRSGWAWWAWEATGDLEASCRRLQRGPAAWGVRHRVLAVSHRTHRRKRPPEDARRPPGNLSGKPNPKTNPIFLLYKTICNKIGLVFGLVFGFGFWISFWICFWILLRRPSRDSFWMKPGAPPGEVF